MANAPVAALTFSAALSFLFPSKSPPPPQFKLPRTISCTKWAAVAVAAAAATTTTTSPWYYSSSFPVVKNDNYFRPAVRSLPLGCSNLCCLKSGNFNVQINVKDEESEDRIVMRFRRAVTKAGILKDCKRRRFFETQQEKKKRKSRHAAARNQKRRPQPKGKTKEGPPKKKNSKVDDEDDNWELPEGIDLPYCKMLAKRQQS